MVIRPDNRRHHGTVGQVLSRLIGCRQKRLFRAIIDTSVIVLLISCYHMFLRKQSLILLTLLSLLSCQPSVRRTLSTFGVDIGDLKYTVLEETKPGNLYEYFNPDLYYFLKLQLDPTQKDELEGLKNRMIHQGAKPLPISESDVNVRLYNNYYETIEGGLYIIETYPENSEDYSVLIYDENKQELIVQRIFI